MYLQYTSLNSGSNGNAYYIGNEREAVLIDAGLSCRETERRMARLDLDMRRVKAIFISHEHTDHTQGVEVISRKYLIPVYISSSTLASSRLRISFSRIRDLKHQVQVNIGQLRIMPFSKHHDSNDPFSFIVSGDSKKVGVFTDIGSVCQNVIDHFGLCDAAFLEANYDEDMLEHGRYPHFLKKRISSEYGHLSNIQALELFIQHRSPSLKHLLLSHLSRDNNDPVRVLELFAREANGVKIDIASRFQESPVFLLNDHEIVN